MKYLIYFFAAFIFENTSAQAMCIRRPPEEMAKKAETIFTFKVKSHSTFTAVVRAEKVFKGDVAKEINLVVAPESRYSTEGVRLDNLIEGKTYLVESYQAAENGSLTLGDCRQPQEIGTVADRIKFYEKTK